MATQSPISPGLDDLDQATAEVDALAQQQQPLQGSGGNVSPGSRPGGPPSRPTSSPVPPGQPSVVAEGGSAEPQPQGDPDNWVQRTIRGLGPIGLTLAHPLEVLGIATGAARAVPQALGAAADFGVDVGEAAGGAINRVVGGDERTPALVRSIVMAAAHYWGRDPHAEHPESSGSFANLASFRSTVGQLGDPDTNELTAQLLSLAVGYGGASFATRAVPLGLRVEEGIQAITSPFLRSAAISSRAVLQGAAVDAVLMDPETERFSNALQGMGVQNEFVDWLAHDDEEGHWAGRFKNALEGTVAGAGMEAIMRVAGFWRAALRGDHAAAASAREDIVANTPIPPEPGRQAFREVDAATAPPPEPSAVPPGQVLVGWGRNEDGTLFPQYGHPADAPPPRTAGEEAAADPAPSEPAPSPEEAPAASPTPQEGADRIVVFEDLSTGRPVGAIDREGLNVLGEQVQIFRALSDATALLGEDGRAALNITHELTPDIAGRVGEMNLAPLGSVDNVPVLLRALMERVPAAARPRTDADLLQAAWVASREVGEDSTALLEAGRLIAGKLSDADTAMAVLRTIWVRATKAIDNLNVPGIDWEAASDEQFAEAARAVHDMTALSAYVQQAKQGLGRGLRVNSLPDAETYVGTLARTEEAVVPMAPGTISPLPRTRSELKDWLEIFHNYKGDPQRRAQFLQGALSIPTWSKYLRQSFANFFTGAILSAPRTLLLNLVGPGIISTVRTVERLTGAGMASLNPLLTSEQRASARIVARETAPAYFSTLNDTADVLYQAWQAMRTNRSILGGGGSIDTQTAFGPITPNLLRATGRTPNPMYRIGNAINVFPAAVARFNNGFDEFAKRMAYNGEVRVRAMVDGAEQGMSGEELRAFVTDKLLNSVDEVGRATDAEMLRAAERTTLTATPGEPGTWWRRIANGTNQLRRDIPEFRYLLPVFNVPANGLGEVLRRTPLAFIPKVNSALGFQRTAAELVGEMGPVAQAEAHGRFLVGASFLASGLMMTRMGLMTGAGPQNRADRATWLANHQPYSIRIGDEWVRYDRYDILGGLLSIPATVADATIYRRADRGQEDLIYGAIGALAQWFKDRAAMRGAAGLLSIGDNPAANAGNVLERLGGTVVGGFVPNAIQATITQPMDPVLRLKDGWADYLRAAIPGLSQELPAVRNIFGEPVNRASDTILEGIFPISMAPAQTLHPDPELDELDRLYQATGFGPTADARNLGHGFFNPQDVVLENNRNLYDAAMHARQTVTVDGQTLRQALHELLASPEYREGVDAGPAEPTTSLGDTSRGWLIERVLQRYNHAIVAELAQASPRARAFLTAAEAKQRDAAYLQDLSVDRLVDNPELYRTRGIDPQLYSDRLQEGSTGALVEALRR